MRDDESHDRAADDQRDDQEAASERAGSSAEKERDDAPHGISEEPPSDFSSGKERQESPEPDLATPTGDDSKTPGRGQQGDYGGKGGEVGGTSVDWKGDTYDQVAEKPPSESEEEQDDLGPTPHAGN